MEISDIKIRKTMQEGRLRAVVSITIDNAIAIHDIKLISANDKYFIVMPSKKVADGTYRDICHPINAEFRASLESAIISAYDVAQKESKTETNE